MIFGFSKEQDNDHCFFELHEIELWQETPHVQLWRCDPQSY